MTHNPDSTLRILHFSWSASYLDYFLSDVHRLEKENRCLSLLVPLPFFHSLKSRSPSFYPNTTQNCSYWGQQWLPPCSSGNQLAGSIPPPPRQLVAPFSLVLAPASLLGLLLSLPLNSGHWVPRSSSNLIYLIYTYTHGSNILISNIHL